MGIAEWHPLPDQIIGKIGGRRKSFERRLSHRPMVRPQMRHHVREGSKAVRHGVNGIEQRLLVFLIILVIGQWLPLHQSQKAEQMAIDPTRLSPNQFRNIGVFLLRHNR